MSLLNSTVVQLDIFILINGEKIIAICQEIIKGWFLLLSYPVDDIDLVH